MIENQDMNLSPVILFCGVRENINSISLLEIIRMRSFF